MGLLSYLNLQMKLEGIGIINGDLIRQVEPVPGEKLLLTLIARQAKFLFTAMT